MILGISCQLVETAFNHWKAGNQITKSKNRNSNSAKREELLKNSKYKYGFTRRCGDGKQMVFGFILMIWLYMLPLETNFQEQKYRSCLS